ncbi:MAG: translation initiation factor IF-2 [Treponema sp.]|nr:translation initiation factor IF-2 [Treponema sp.]MBQ5384730.1 translation initiation factor IF-2 [Treponema sp.]
MAEEEKKTEANKTESQGSQPKKKIVIKRKSPSSASAQKEQKKHVVVKKNSDASPASEEKKSVPSGNATEPVKKTEAQAKPEASSVQQGGSGESKPAGQKAPEQTKTQGTDAEKPQRQVKTFELNSVRPNVKAGNLSGGPRGRYNNGRRDSGFTGTQAREGYQNRQGGYNNNGQRQGGYNNGQRQGGYNNGQRQGGYNNGQRQGGYNNGQRQGGFNGQPRPGMGGGRPDFSGPRTGSGGFANPAALAGNKAPAKKQFKGKKQVYNRKDEEQAFGEDELYGNKKKEITPASVVPEKIDIMDSITVADLAKKMNLKASEIIGKLMANGMMVTINQSIDADTAEIIASEYKCTVNRISLYEETVIESDKGTEEGLCVRPPIVTVMGHVDHGKTKTLDAIRNTNVVAGEAGGITQKIGAYQVSTPKGVITFLDTPGHEAFTMMRARGAQITDIVVLVVAADDGVMPQTLEAINHAKDAKVPIIVAVNKIDKPEANPDRVMTQLSELGLTPEAWGGDTQYVNISALKREGIDELLDAILIQAEMLELKAQYDCRAEGKVIESRVDQGRGVVASVVVERGTLRTGDPFVAGIYSGRVRVMFDDRGKKITEATPSMPVEVLGMVSMPNAGDPFQVTESEKDARAFAAKRQELKRYEDAKAFKKVTLDSLYTTIEQREIKEFKVIIKADLQGSAEALKTSLEKLSTRDIRLSVIHSSAGAINESDVTLAAADENAIIIGFNVRPTPKAKALADQEKVEIRKYNIIYKCVEEITAAMEGMLQPDTKEEVTGMLEVRNTFKVPKVGVIAGCYVTDGIIKRSSSVNVIRDGVVKFTGKVSSLKHFKDDVKEVKFGFECGVGIENWQDLQVGDQLEAFEYVEVARKLGKTIAEEQAEAKAESEAGGTQE